MEPKPSSHIDPSHNADAFNSLSQSLDQLSSDSAKSKKSYIVYNSKSHVYEVQNKKYWGRSLSAKDIATKVKSLVDEETDKCASKASRDEMIRKLDQLEKGLKTIQERIHTKESSFSYIKGKMNSIIRALSWRDSYQTIDNEIQYTLREISFKKQCLEYKQLYDRAEQLVRMSAEKIIQDIDARKVQRDE